MTKARAILSLALAVSLGSVSGEASAQNSSTPELQGIPVVVEMRGQRKYGTDRLSRTLRRSLADALGGLRSSRALKREQERLRTPKQERTKPSRLAEAARAIGADYLVFVRVTRKAKGQHVAKAYMIEGKTSKIVHKHSEMFGRPSREAGPAGKRVAAAVLDALIRIKAAETPPPPPPPAPIAENVPKPAISTEPELPTMAVPPKSAGHSGRAAAASAPDGENAPPKGLATRDTPLYRPGPIAVRIGVGAGAGVLRSYNVASDAVAASNLSHSLSPQGMATLSAELHLTELGLGVIARTSLRPVGYDIVVDNESLELGGMLVDGLAGVRFHIGLQGGPRPVELLPAAGVRVSRSSVEAHAQGVIPNSTLLSTFGRLGVRIPYDAGLELGAGVDFGFLAAYSEGPSKTGNDPTGFSVGADIGLRFWFSELLGLAFDTRFTLDRLSFSDQPTRAVTRNEQAGLVDARVSITDVRTAAAVLFRL